MGHRRGWNLALLWLWCRPAATALIQPLAWEPPNAVGAALKRKRKKKKRLTGYIVVYPYSAIKFNTLPIQTTMWDSSLKMMLKQENPRRKRANPMWFPL